MLKFVLVHQIRHKCCDQTFSHVKWPIQSLFFYSILPINSVDRVGKAVRSLLKRKNDKTQT